MVFCFVQNFFFGHTRVRIFFFFYGTKREHFFQNLTLGYDKNSESDYFLFPPPKSEYFFQPTLGIQNIFFQKKTVTPPPWKLNGPSLS